MTHRVKMYLLILLARMFKPQSHKPNPSRIVDNREVWILHNPITNQPEERPVERTETGWKLER
jgi:hypothetical protein